MKKIALLMDGWKRYFTYAWPSGILQRIHETDEDVNLYIFNSSGNWSRDEAYNEAEYNIFSLPNLCDFDGIILDINNILHSGVTTKVVEQAKKAGVPVISIGQNCEDFYYVGIDNQKAMVEVLKHLVEEHHCRRFWFVMGPEDNYENSQRVQAIHSYLAQKNIPISETNFYYESFEYESGDHGFLELMRRNKNIPEAIVCANDNIAVGVCESARRYGYHAPADFLVTGFDNFDKAEYYTPRITTVSHIREEVGYKCAEILLDIWKGLPVPQFNYTETKTLFWESCGCDRVKESSEREYLRKQIIYNIETDHFEEEVQTLEYELLKCRTFKDMLECITEGMPSMKCDAMYLVLDNQLNDYKSRLDRQESETNLFCIEGYPRRMKVEYAYELGQPVELNDPWIEDIFPMFESEEGGVDLLFLPLHFRHQTIGYFVIRNAIYLMEKQYLHQIINALTKAMENLHKKEILEYMNERLSDLYIHDAMSGLYNRLGGMKLSQELFEKSRQRSEALFVMYVDLDRLKYINDTFGHEMGDYAIKTVSKSLRTHFEKLGIASRLGGDEFLIVGRSLPREKIELVIAEIRDELAMVEKNANLEFKLQISTGYVYTDVYSNQKLDDYINLADTKMYEEKSAKKAHRAD